MFAGSAESHKCVPSLSSHCRLASHLCLSPTEGTMITITKLSRRMNTKCMNTVQIAKLFSYTWQFGWLLCKLAHYSETLSVVCSVLNLTALSVERWAVFLVSCCSSSLDMFSHFIIISLVKHVSLFSLD